MKNIRKSPGLEIFSNRGIFIPGIWKFLKSEDFYQEDSGFFKIWRFLSPGIRDILKSWDFHPGNWGFSSLEIGDFYEMRGIFAVLISRGLGIF